MSQTFLEDIPEFLEIQRNSFLRILDIGLIEALETINPISPPPNCEYGLLFYPQEYVLVLPPHTTEEAFLQGKTYGCKIYVPAIIVNSLQSKIEKNSVATQQLSLTNKSNSKIDLKGRGFASKDKKPERFHSLQSKISKSKEWVCIGVLPLMTRRGHFIINGSPRIVISQMSRAPGLYYQTGEKLQATVVPSKGAWFRMSVTVTKKGEIKIWVRITPYRKMPYKIFMETYKHLENPESFAQSEFLDLAYKSVNIKIKDFDKQYGIGPIRRQINLTIRNPSSYTLGTLGRKRINERLADNSQKKYLTSKDISNIKETLLNFLYKKIYTGSADDIDHLENRRVRTCGELLQSEIEVGMDRLKKAIRKQLDTYYNPDSSLFLSPKNLGTSGPMWSGFGSVNTKQQYLIRKPLAISSKQSQEAKPSSTSNVKKSILSANKELLPPPFAYFASQYFCSLQSKEEAKKTKSLLLLGAVGGSPSFALQGIEGAKVAKAKKPNLFASQNKVKAPKKKDEQLLSKKTQLNAELQTQMANSETKESFLLSPSKLVNTKAFASALREFFGSNPLSQYMDQTNPLAEITHKRRLSSLGPGGVDRASAGIAIRGIHPTHYGRICPIETPEGKNAGLVNSMTMWARLNSDGFLQTPYLTVKGGSIMPHTQNLSPAWQFVPTRQEGLENKALKIVASDLKLSKKFLPKIALPTRDGSSRNFVRRNRDVIDFFGVSPIQNISVATSLIPFLEHDDATRALMGSNMQRQAVPLLKPQAPLIRTGLEGKVVGESGHALQAVSSGFVSSATRISITIDSFKSREKTISSINKPISFLPSFGLKFLGLGFPIYKQQVVSLQIQHWPCFPNSFIKQSPYKCFFVLLNAQQKSFGGELILFPKHTSRKYHHQRAAMATSCYLPSKKEASKTKKYKNQFQVRTIAKQSFFFFIVGKRRLPVFAIKNREHKTDFSKKVLLYLLLLRNKKQEVSNGTFSFQSLLPALVYKQKLFSLFAVGKQKNCTEQNQSAKKAYPPNCKKAKIERTREIQTLQQYTRSNQATICVQRPAVREGQWVQKGDLLGDCSASKHGVLALGQNIVVAYLPMEGFNFEDAIVVSDRLVYEELYTSIHVERVEFDMEAVPKRKLPRKTKVKTNRNTGLATAIKTLQQDWITWHNPHLQSREKKALNPLGIVKIGSWVGPNDVLVSKVFPIQKTLAPSRHLLLAVFKEKKMEPLSTTDTSVRVPKGIHGRVINLQILYTGRLLPSDSASNLFYKAINKNCQAKGLISKKKTETALSPLMSKASNATAIRSKYYVSEAKGKSNVNLLLESFGCGFFAKQLVCKSIFQLVLLGGGNVDVGAQFHQHQLAIRAIRNKHLYSKKQSKQNQVLHRNLLELDAEGKQSREQNTKNLINEESTFTKHEALALQMLRKLNKKQGLTVKNIAQKSLQVSATSYLRPPLSFVLNRSKNAKKGLLNKHRLEKGNSHKEFTIVQVRVYIAERKKLQVGDKMSGRHGNKGIVSTILPREDMPYLPDGTCVDMVLNPLGIPSRMNVGQVFECLLGLATAVCGDIISHTPFDEMYGPEASRSLVYLFLYAARLRARADWLFQPVFPGKTILFDGRTGTPFEQWVTVGRAYMLKLIHMVDEKIHARSVGSRSIVTQQPVKGRARGGGQRVGEMEVWAFEGFGAAYTLQELLTIKSDDIFGRERVEDTIISGTTLSAHVPETFKILLFELRCLCLNVELNAKDFPKRA